MKYLKNKLSYSCFENEDKKPKKSSMVLRSRNLLKKTSLFQSISQILPKKQYKYSDLFSFQNNGVLKKKTKQSKNPTLRKFPDNPYMAYRRNLTQTPVTPINPFNETSSGFQRKTKRLSAISNKNSSSVKKASYGSAVKKLIANSYNLNEAIDNDGAENHNIFKLNETKGSTQTPLKPDNTGLKNARAGVKRRLSTRLKKYSNLETCCSSSTPRSSQRLCGKYNQAHYFDG